MLQQQSHNVNLFLVWAVARLLLGSLQLEACISEPPLDTYFARPRVNAAPVASVKLSYEYQQMTQPLWLEHTGRSLLAENLNGNAGGGFKLDTLPTDPLQGGSTEVYRPVQYALRSIRVRAPGLHAGKPEVAGTTESSQVLELALLHREKQANGEDGGWAVLYIPFVQADQPLQNDPMLSFVVDAELPTMKGQVGHAQLRLPWNLADVMPVQWGSMLHYWGKLVAPPCGPNVIARHIVRQEPIPIAAATLAPILAVLGRAAENAGFMSYSPPTNVWQMPTCPGLAKQCPSILSKGQGYTMARTAIKDRIKATQSERAGAKMNLYAAQAALNNSLVQLRGAQSGNNAQNQTEQAQNLATALHAAEQRMEAAIGAEAEAYADLRALPNTTMEWDSENPGTSAATIGNTSSSNAAPRGLFGPGGPDSARGTNSVTKSTAANSSVSEDASPASANAEDANSQSHPSATNSMSLLNLVLGVSDSEESAGSDSVTGSDTNSAASAADEMTEMQSCAQWHGAGAEAGLSPVNIKTDDIADLASLAQVVSSPAMFRYDGDLGKDSRRRLWLENIGGSLRATALPTDNAAPGGPLGVLSFGAEGLFELKTIELKVPGEHSVDGNAPVAELQLIHHRQGEDESKHEPVAVLSIRLAEAEEDGMDNPWLEAFMNTLPHVDEAMEVYGAPLWSAASDLASTSGIPPYYRYDGTTTSPPCRAAKWFMLKDTGFISARQLNALKLVLMPKPAPLLHPLGERIVVQDSPLALQKKSARALLQALRKHRSRATSNIAP